MKNTIWQSVQRILLTGLLLLGCFLSMPEPVSAQAGEPETVPAGLSDGEYTVEVALEGGTGKATVTSPAVLRIESGKAFAEIAWSSSHYDYMVVDGEKYLPVSTEGNSVFEIPVTVFDEPMPVIADTTAMSMPHEIEYTLTFASGSISSGKASLSWLSAAVCAGAVLVVILILAGVYVKKRKGNEEK